MIIPTNNIEIEFIDGIRKKYTDIRNSKIIIEDGMLMFSHTDDPSKPPIRTAIPLINVRSTITHII